MITQTFPMGFALGAAVPAATKAAILRLQRALSALGTQIKDSSLKISADGAMGPKTAAATNRAFTVHLGAGQAPAQYRTGSLTQAQITSQAATLAGLVETEVRRRQTAAKAPAKAAAKPAAAKAPAKQGTSLVDKLVATQAVVTAATPLVKTGKQIYTAVKKKPADTTPIKALQLALTALGTQIKDSALKIAADGVIGPKTVAAVNRAFTKHLGAGQAPAQYRTGKLTQAQVVSVAATLTTLLQQETARRQKVSGVKTSTALTTKKTTTATAAEDDTESDEDVVSTATAPGGEMVMPEARDLTPYEANEGFFSKYKMPLIIGGGALTLLIVGTLVLRRRDDGGGYFPRPAYARRRR